MFEDDGYFGRLESHRTGPSEPRRRAPPDDDFKLSFGKDDELTLPEEERTEAPLQQLIRYWMNERHAPDILPVQEELLARMLNHIRKQVGDEDSVLLRV